MLHALFFLVVSYLPMNSSLTIPVAVVIGGLIVAAAVYISIKPDSAVFGDGSAYDTTVLRAVDARDHVLGNPAAPVKIIEYSDYDCPHCKTFATTLHQIIANEGTDGEVAWVQRQCPLTELHP